MTSALDVAERDWERAAQAYVGVLEEGYWVKPGLSGTRRIHRSRSSRDMSLPPTKRPTETAAGWREWYEGLHEAYGRADWPHDWDWIDKHRPPAHR